MSDSRLQDQAYCGCGEADAPLAPGIVWNRPALPEIAWRIGRFAGFRAAALRDLTRALPLLTSREGDDHAITLIELWAALADVLTFHGERIANESYLRTAVHRDSVRRLVRLLDYRPFAGLAAETDLAFTLDPGATLTLKPGLKVMSVPGQDELPQIFETLEQVAGEARLNRVAVRGVPIPHDPLAEGASRAALLSAPERLGPGDPLLFFWADAAEEKTLAKLAAPAREREAAWSPPNVRAMPQPALMAKVERAMRLFGHNAPASRIVFDEGEKSSPTTWSRPPGWVKVQEAFGIAAADSAAGLPLDARIEGLKPGATIVADLGQGALPVRLAVVTAVSEATETFGAATDKVTRIAVARQVLGRPSLSVLTTGSTRLVTRLATGICASFFPGAGGPVEPVNFPTVGGAPVPLTGDPIVAEGFGRTELVARGAGTALWYTRSLPGFVLTWVRLGGALKGDPVLLVPAADRTEIVARGWDDAIWLRRATGSGNAPAWAEWVSLGGRASGPVAAAAVPASGGVACVAVRGVDGEAYANFIGAATATGWRALPSLQVAAELAVVAVGTFFAVLARAASDNGLRLCLVAPTGSSPWVEVPGEEVVAGRPAMALAAGTIGIAARSDQDKLLFRAWGLSGVATDWEDLGGPIGSDPAIAIAGTRIVVAARFADGTLRMREQNAGSWGAWRVMGEGLGAIPNRRTVRLWQVAQPFLDPRRHDYPQTITGSRVTVPLAELDSIAAKRRIILTDGRITQVATVAGAAAMPADAGGEPAVLAIDVAAPLAVPLDGAATVLLGNVVHASHGETLAEEILGDGDAATPLQRFALKRAPVTRRAAAGALRGVPDITVLVGDEAWTPVETLFGRGPAERIYVLEEAEDGTTIVQFGDGLNGARLPTGAGNIRVRYRIGLGLAGQVRAAQLSVPLTRPPGLREATNPLPAGGGADPEDAESARRNAPRKVLTFGRAISLRDLEALAIESGLAAQARADWIWSGIERLAHLTVAAPGGAAPSADTLAKLAAVLDAARDTTRRLLIGAVRRVPVRIAGLVFIEDAFVRDAVMEAARGALAALLAPDSLGIAMPLHRSDVIAALQGVRGVKGVDLDALGLRGDPGWTAAQRQARDLAPGPLQQHLRLFPARASASAVGDPLAKPAPGTVLPRILPAEQAFAETTDILLFASGGLA
ncbi:hypothetical protein GXW74_06735 [Roseomonas eburnea]|uniref:PLL-like beta propeller domain-containing protein n=1 Tax=Neoroseomonas eburnea TaxID=1346889 RepID=A0A9X9X8Z0_9PROT|nr:hypothetical protein [Neoroseomonas eburnea]MBR0680176.1 hypothetical protein [Neoroseomonas eburnea]